jgi:phosphohistidine phosphatase
MADPSDLVVDRTLVLLRHAKAVRPETVSVPDLERPLAKRGHRDATAAGHWLVSRGLEPDLVLCSTSVRTRETWDLVVSAGLSAGDVWYDRRIYEADPGTLLDVVHEVPESASVVLLVGHAPGVPWLAHELATGPGREALVGKYPTSGLAVLRHTTRWSTLTAADAVLADFVTPRG